MRITINQQNDLKSSEITPENIFLQRRQFIKNAAVFGALCCCENSLAAFQRTLFYQKNEKYDLNERLTPKKYITEYNNFFEFSTQKKAVKTKAQHFITDPWQIKVSGHAEKTGTYDLYTLMHQFPLEQRIYRFRCIEAWSMVVPWVGVPLSKVLAYFKPLQDAKYVEFKTLYDPQQMPNQKIKLLDWPYTEGLRIDEAMHPLTLLVTGVYGKPLAPQNGAPVRLIVPWKYGFKSIKSIVSIRFTQHQPVSSWHQMIPEEYGFYANVNPNVRHPKWQQNKERRLGKFFKQKTLMFNGYANEVASLYQNMNLLENY